MSEGRRISSLSSYTVLQNISSSSIHSIRPPNRVGSVFFFSSSSSFFSSISTTTFSFLPLFLFFSPSGPFSSLPTGPRSSRHTTFFSLASNFHDLFTSVGVSAGLIPLLFTATSRSSTFLQIAFFFISHFHYFSCWLSLFVLFLSLDSLPDSLHPHPVNPISLTLSLFLSSRSPFSSPRFVRWRSPSLSLPPTCRLYPSSCRRLLVCLHLVLPLFGSLSLIGLGPSSAWSTLLLVPSRFYRPVRRPTGLPARGSPPPPPPQRSESGSPGIGRHKKEKRNTFQRLVHNDSHTLSAQRTTNDLSYRSLAPSFSRSLRSSRSHGKRERKTNGSLPCSLAFPSFSFSLSPSSSLLCYSLFHLRDHALLRISLQPRAHSCASPHEAAPRVPHFPSFSLASSPPSGHHVSHSATRVAYVCTG